MTSIIKATISDVALIADMGRQTFIESHGHSASEADITGYINEKYSHAEMTKELSDHNNIYYIVYHDEQPAGFSKIVFNVPHHSSGEKALTKLERIYLLNQFYGLHLGKTLLEFNIELARQHQQQGIWLNVWTENHRAVNFYKRNGFVAVGTKGFRISATHYNPNYQMLLRL